jgi:hypothetical protein
MIAPLVLLVGASMAAAQETRTYTNSALGLSLTIPAGWTVETNRRQETKFGFTTTGGPATVEIFPSAFRQDAELWQRLQNEISRQLDRQVERQWQEVLLGVPLLMSKINYPIGGEATSTLVGLLYTATRTKLHFRLTSPSRGYDEAEAAWRAALQTLRTTSGELPVTEDPTRPQPPAKPRREASEPRPIGGAKPAPVARRSASYLDAVLGDRPVRLYHAPGWSFAVQDGGYLAQRAGLEGKFRVRLRSRLDSPAADQALAEEVAMALARFSSVEFRIDTNPTRNAAGAMVSTVLRQGITGGGPIVRWNAIGVNGDLFWQAEYEGTPDQHRRDRERLGEWARTAILDAAG